MDTLMNSASIKLRHFLGWLSNYQLLKDDYTLRKKYYLILIVIRLY
jgi:hypothetical protein